jgi:hypothetical protein
LLEPGAGGAVQVEDLALAVADDEDEADSEELKDYDDGRL